MKQCLSVIRYPDRLVRLCARVTRTSARLWTHPYDGPLAKLWNKLRTQDDIVTILSNTVPGMARPPLPPWDTFGRGDLRPFLCHPAYQERLERFVGRTFPRPVGPELFRTAIQPQVPNHETGAWLGLYWDLELNTQMPLLTACAFLAADRLVHTASWLDLLRRVPPAHRLRVLLAVIWERSDSAPAPTLTDDQTAAIEQVRSPELAADCWETVGHGIRPDYVVAGALRTRAWSGNSKPSFYPPNLDETLERLRPLVPCHVLGRLWERLGRDRRLEKHLGSLLDSSHSTAVKGRLVELYTGWREDIRGRQLQSLVEAALTRVPRTHQTRFLTAATRMLNHVTPRQSGPLVQLLAGMCGASFPTRSLRTSLLFDLLEGNLIDVLIRSGTPTWKAIEQANDHWEESRMTGIGLSRLYRVLPALVARTLKSSPGPLLRAGHLAGTLQRPDFYRTSWNSHPLLQDAEPVDLIKHLPVWCPTTWQHRISKRLWLHYAAGRPLPDWQRDHDLAALRRNLDLIRLDFIRHQTEAVLTQQAPDLHTGQMLTFANENRRALRQLVSAWQRGDRDYLVRHCKTQSWLTRHPGIRADTLQSAIEHQHGPLHLSLENNPMEILKMGTSVGTCLSVGRGWCYSAAACALDLNRRVVYLRENGRIVARQLVAISDDNRLVCFFPYPIDTPHAGLFVDYDIDLAIALGIELHDDDDEPYTIANILSTNAHDDGAWNFDVTTVIENA